MDQILGWQAGSRQGAVENLSRFVAASIDAARAGDLPFEHLVFERVFPDDVYNAMLAALPAASDYRGMSEKRRRVDFADGADTRFKIDLLPEYIRHLPAAQRAIWNVVGRALCSHAVRDALVRRLSRGLERCFGEDFARVGMYPLPILTRDVTGYHIIPHTDTHWKAITVQFYLPPDDSIAHVGTVFNERVGSEFPKRAQMKFLPNTGYAFAVGTDTWHSVERVGPEVKMRDSILLTYYVDASLLTRLRNRGKRIGNFLLNEVRHATGR